jgi:hypothetical protein
MISILVRLQEVAVSDSESMASPSDTTSHRGAALVAAPDVLSPLVLLLPCPQPCPAPSTSSCLVHKQLAHSSTDAGAGRNYS